MAEEFSYVIARPWKDTEPESLCIYTYHNEIQHGTKESAKRFLEYVRSRSDSDSKKYAIYKVKFKKVD